MSENELKKQLEEINIFIESCGFVNIEQLAFNYISLRQQIENDSKINVAYNKYAIECENKANVLETHQKEFIKYLEDKIEVVENKIFKLPIASYERNYLVNVGNDLIEILQKSKEIIGDDK